MKLISIELMSKIAFIYSIIYILFDFLYFFIYKLIKEKFNNDNDDNINRNYIYLCLMKNISNILLIFLYFILKKKNDNKPNENYSNTTINNSNSSLQITILVVKNKNSYIFNFTNICYIFICSLIDFFILFYNKQIITSGFAEFFGFLFFIYFFNHSIYLHHYLGLIVIIIIAIVKTIIFFIEKENQKNKNIISLIIYSLLGFQIVIEKYLIEIKFLNKIIILTMEGIFELIFLAIYVIFYSKKNENYKLFSNFYYLYIFILLVCLIVNCSRINSIEYNKNIISLIIFIFSQYISSHILKINDKKTNNGSIIFPFLEIINIFGCLIIMEIIVLNFCKINKNIKSQIRKREELDMQNIL